MKKNTVVRFTIDFKNKQIVGTKASFDKASKGFGPAYDELAEKSARHPTFEMSIKEQKKHTTKEKRTYEGMSFDFMEAYISLSKDAEQLMRDYVAVKAMAKKLGISVYPFTKKWFLKKFGSGNSGFDMAKAREEISDYRIANATQTPAASAGEEMSRTVSAEIDKVA